MCHKKEEVLKYFEAKQAKDHLTGKDENIGNRIEIVVENHDAENEASIKKSIKIKKLCFVISILINNVLLSYLIYQLINEE